MSDLVCNLKLPGAVLGVVAIVWMAGNSNALHDHGYDPTGHHSLATRDPAPAAQEPLYEAQASLRLDQ